ncbi:hypothetical protein [Bradyrhizobium sp.]
MSLGAWGDESWERNRGGPVEITEMLLRMPKPITRGLIVNMPARGMSFHARLFQARMWRETAMAIKYDRPTMTGTGRRWHLEIGHHTYADSLRRARVNLYLAHRLNRKTAVTSADRGVEK